MIEATGFAVELTEAELAEMYRQMLSGRTIGRHLEAMLADSSGRASLLLGGEAIQVAMAFALEADDVLGSGPHDATALLGRGRRPSDVIGEVVRAARPGRRGFGVVDAAAFSPVPVEIVVPATVGTALALALGETAQVALAGCTAEATASGVWHESVEMAARHRLPVVFAVRSVRRADHEHRSAADRAAGYGLPGEVVDGSDVLECYDALRSAVERARSGAGPSLIETVLVASPTGDVTQVGDCLQRFEEYLGVRGMLDEHRRDHLEGQIDDEVDRAVRAAGGAPEAIGRRSQLAGRTSALLSAPAAGPPSGSPVGGAEAVRAAVEAEMDRDDRVVVLAAAGAAACELDRFGDRRVLRAPCGPESLLGLAWGAALGGLRPVVFAEPGFGMEPVDRFLSAAGSHHADTGVAVPLVVVASPESAPEVRPSGVRVLEPSSPGAAKGLAVAAVRDANPAVIVVSPELQPEAVPPGSYELALDRARVVREGSAVTIVVWGCRTAVAEAAADELAGEGVSAAVVGLESLAPVDWATVAASLEATGRLVILDPVEASVVGNEIAARAASESLWSLDAPVARTVVAVGDATETAGVVAAVRTLVRT